MPTSVTTNFQVIDRDVNQRDSLGRIVLTANIQEIGRRGPPGQSTYQAWLNLGNSGTEADFLLAMADSVRPRFIEHEPSFDYFDLPEVPTDEEALAAGISLNGAVGDVLVYETPYSLAGYTLDPVIYQWELLKNDDSTVNGISGLRIEKRHHNIPVYTRILQLAEVRPGFHYKLDDGSGLFPHEWKVNVLGTPVELYINPSVDYEILSNEIDLYDNKVRGSANEAETLESLRSSIELINSTFSSNNGEIDFSSITTSLNNKEEIGVAQTLVDALEADINVRFDDLNLEERIGKLTGYVAADGPLISPGGQKNSHFVILDEMLVDDITVLANTVIRLNKDTIGGIVGDWDVDPIATIMLRGSSTPIVSVINVVMPLLEVNTWTDFPANTFSILHTYEIRNNIGEIKTDSFDIRLNNDVYQIKTLVEQVNLQFKLTGI